MDAQNPTPNMLPSKNLKLLGLGCLIITAGFIIMRIGPNNTLPEMFNYKIFAWHRIILAPIVIVTGFLFQIYALFKK